MKMVSGSGTSRYSSLNNTGVRRSHQGSLLWTSCNRANLSRTHFVSGYNLGLLLINLCKERPYIGNQEIGLLQGREVSALRHASSLYYVVRLSYPAKRRDSHVLGKIGISHRGLQVWRRHHF